MNEFHGQWGRDLETAGANASGPSVGMGVGDLWHAQRAASHCRAGRASHPVQRRFSTTHGKHTFKFGGDVNLVHEVMINLFQGGGIYSYGESTNCSTSRIGFGRLCRPGGRYRSLRRLPLQQPGADRRPGEQGSRNAGQGRLLDEDVGRLCRGHLEGHAKLYRDGGRALRHPADPDSGLGEPLVRSDLVGYTSSIKNVTDRIQPRVAFSWSPLTGTVVRGGYGLFSALNQGSTYYAMRVENGVVQLNYSYAGCVASSVVPSAALAARHPATSATQAALSRTFRSAFGAAVVERAVPNWRRARRRSTRSSWHPATASTDWIRTSFRPTRMK